MEFSISSRLGILSQNPYIPNEDFLKLKVIADVDGWNE